MVLKMTILNFSHEHISQTIAFILMETAVAEAHPPLNHLWAAVTAGILRFCLSHSSRSAVSGMQVLIQNKVASCDEV